MKLKDKFTLLLIAYLVEWVVRIIVGALIVWAIFRGIEMLKA